MDVNKKIDWTFSIKMINITVRKVEVDNMTRTINYLQIANLGGDKN